MDPEEEAARIPDELGEVVFVGALAVNHYAKFRSTKDIDFAMAGPLDEANLSGLGYRKKGGSGGSWYGPREVQVDIYTRDVRRIPVSWILKNAVPVIVGRKKINVISLEGLLLAKLRAGRSQDVADLRHLMANRGQAVRWRVMKEIATDLETAELGRLADALVSR